MHNTYAYRDIVSASAERAPGTGNERIFDALYHEFVKVLSARESVPGVLDTDTPYPLEDKRL